MPNPDTQDELLYTMALDLVPYNLAELSFWNSGFDSLAGIIGTVITLEFSTDIVKEEWTVIWTFPEPAWTPGGQWYEHTIDLSELTGQTIWLGWRYTFDGVSEPLGINYYLDDVYLDAVCDGCLIGGECYDDGDDNPDNFCQLCDPLTTADDWTDKPEETACDDGLFCTIDDECNLAAECVGVDRDCDDGEFCTGVETCDEDSDECVSPGDPCPPDEECFEEFDLCSAEDDDIADDDVADDDVADDDVADDDVTDDDLDDDTADDDAGSDDDDDDDGCGC